MNYWTCEMKSLVVIHQEEVHTLSNIDNMKKVRNASNDKKKWKLVRSARSGSF